MQKYEINLIELERIIKKRYKIILFCTILVTAFSLLFMRSREHLYRATSSVKIERSNTMGGLMNEFMSF